MSEWQLIETADTKELEGRTVLLGWLGTDFSGVVTTGFWSGDYHGLNAWAGDDENAFRHQPTHWMELPDPPK